MEQLDQILEWAGVVLWVVLGVAAFRQWLRHRDESTAWLLATFGILAAVVVIGQILPEEGGSTATQWFRKLLVAMLVLFPYSLWRFSLTFVMPSRWFWVLAHVLTGVVILWTFFLPDFPGEGEPRPAVFQAYVIVLLIQWVTLSTRVAWRLWRAGRGQPTVARRRMRTLSAGSLGLALALVVAGLAPSGEEVTPAGIAVQLLSLASGPLFLLGFAPPGLVRIAWRRPEEEALRAAELRLMAAHTPEEVADTLLPEVRRLLGGDAAVLVDGSGDVVASDGIDNERAFSLVEAASDHGDDGSTMMVELENGRLAVSSNRFSPFFGREERDILTTLSVLADLALSRTKLLRDLARSNEELEQFAYVASHDLQEPLRTVSSYVELLEERYRSQLDDKAEKWIDYVVEGCTRMQNLINDLLAFSRVGTQGGALVEVDARHAAEQALVSLRASVEETQAQVAVGDLPVVEADEAQLVQLFQNLIGNAIKYRKPDETARISVTGHPNGREAIFTVADNGIGIDPKYADRIFTIFQRLHTRSEYSGTGIGLAICKKIVERHGGQIWLDDASRDGAVFHFTLPLGRAR